jgi:small nuclear ribonucleoprotein (snRNP)-like protein
MPTPSSILENALLHALGQMVTVTLKNGEKWTGVFHGANAISHLAPSQAQELAKEENKKWGLVLRMASRVQAGVEGKGLMEKPVPVKMVDDSELVALRYVLPKRATKTFQTDAEIGAQTGTVNTERVLTSWASTAGSSGAGTGSGGPSSAAPAKQAGQTGHGAGEEEPLGFTLSEKGHDVGSWNQFEANAAMLNKAATPYREEFYTTTIDRSSPAYLAKLAEASRLAREIESGASDDKHLAEERGQLDEGEDDMDEEDRYSMVLPTAKTKGTYVVPALRGKEAAAAAAANAPASGGTPKSGGSPKNSRSSSPRLSGLNLATSGGSAAEKKAFQPYSLDPAKNPVAVTAPNPATRTEDTAKLRKSSTDLDEKVKKASGTAPASTGSSGTSSPTNTSEPPAAAASGAAAAAAAAAKKRDMRSFANATAWVAPGQRKGQEIFESLLGSGAAPSTPPTPISPPLIMTQPPPQNVYPMAGPPLQHPMAMGMPPQMQPMQPMQHTLITAQQPPIQHTPVATQVDPNASPAFKALIRNDVYVRPLAEIAKLTPASLEPKKDWERSAIVAPYAPGYAFPNQQFAFAQPMPGMPPAALMMGAPYPNPNFAPHVQYMQQLPHQ